MLPLLLKKQALYPCSELVLFGCTKLYSIENHYVMVDLTLSNKRITSFSKVVIVSGVTPPSLLHRKQLETEILTTFKNVFYHF